MEPEQENSDHEEAFLGDDADDEVVADLQGSVEEGYESDTEGGDAGMSLQDDSIHSFSGHQDAVFAVAWSPQQSDLVATGGGDDRAFLWRVGQTAFDEGRATTHELAGHSDSVASLAFNSSGGLLASGGLDGRVKVWEASSGRCLHGWEGPSEAVEWLSWHPRGNVVLAGSEDFTVWMWNAQTGACMQVLTGHGGPVTCGGFTPDGKLIVTGGGEGDCTLKVWNPKTGECSLTLQGHGFHEQGLTSLDLHPDSATVVTGSEDSKAKISNVHTGKVVGTLEGHTDTVEAVAFAHTLPVVATGSLDDKLIIWDNSTLTARSTCQHPDGVIRIATPASAPVVYTGCADGVVRCWDLRTGECVRTWTGHSAAIQDIAVSPDGKHVLSGSDDRTAKVFGESAFGEPAL